MVGAPSIFRLLLLTAVAPALLAVLLGAFSSLTAPSYPVPAKGSAVVITGTSTGQLLVTDRSALEGKGLKGLSSMHASIK